MKKIVDALRARGELDNTVLIFTSDNGFFHGEHRIPEGKQRIYEESIRVPLLIRGPGIPRGVRVATCRSTPTWRRRSSTWRTRSPAWSMDGRSLIPVAQQPGIEQGRELLIEEPSFKAIRTERYMYAEHGTGERELYDLKQRPVRARESPRRPRLRIRQGPARSPPPPAAELRRFELPHRPVAERHPGRPSPRSAWYAARHRIVTSAC